ncbi:MAG TPA: leucine--tRNA ligase, partial [Myxococcota bacterium]|nr:leucine--tRNA ligase [Myxococcota bacterium]
MRQWMLKITEYAERLLADLDEVDWPESVKEMQRNWIGKSTGALLEFNIEGSLHKLKVFTTRPDTIFGATFCVLAPEHELLKYIVSPEQREQVDAYIAFAASRPETRTEDSKKKTGIFTGAYALHPITKDRMPIYVADYVLNTYGTGAIMAVPAHDERDYEFAKDFGLSIIEVVVSKDGSRLERGQHNGPDTRLVNSDFLNGLSVPDAILKAIAHAEAHGYGQARVQYRLRDWLFSRQRYWGEPFPIVYDSKGNPHPVSESDLPVSLPEIDEYRPTDDGEPPLARADDSWRRVILKDGSFALREINTMPQWAGSCWYYLRYLDPNNDQAAFDPALERYFMPVDLYIGGVEHAVLHLLYA